MIQRAGIVKAKLARPIPHESQIALYSGVVDESPKAKKLVLKNDRRLLMYVTSVSEFRMEDHRTYNPQNCCETITIQADCRARRVLALDTRRQNLLDDDNVATLN